MGNSMANGISDDIDFTGSDIYSSEDPDEFADEGDGSEHLEPGNFVSLSMLLQQIMEHGHIGNFFDMDEGEEGTGRSYSRMPSIRGKPNVANLQTNNIYQSVKYASGYGDEYDVTKNSYSVFHMISRRQSGVGGTEGSFSRPDRSMIYNKFLPNRSQTIADFGVKFFCGVMSRDGRNFLTASQDHIIRIYDATTPLYRHKCSISAKDVNWGILDIDFSPNGEDFVYSTWSDSIFIGQIRDADVPLEAIHLRTNRRRFCVFSVAFSNDGEQLICGASDKCLYICDRNLNTRTLKIPVRGPDYADVNAVGFADETSNIFLSGSDDGVVRVWDRRCLNEEDAKPVGTFVGHYDGITYIDSKNDGRYLISNSKDQCIKLWDMRKFSPSKCCEANRQYPDWDYRWDEIPKAFYNVKSPLPGDVSVMTYRGHRVMKTLLRAKFSPLETTGQRYIYTGCASGRLIIYDLLTGKIVAAMKSHKDVVRDVAWHPHRMEILTSGFDARVYLYWYGNDDEFEKKTIATRRSKRIASQNRRNPQQRSSNDR